MTETDQNSIPPTNSGQQLSSSIKQHPRSSKRLNKVRLVIGTGLIFIIALGFGIYFLLSAPKQTYHGLPINIVDQVSGFKIYYFKQTPPLGFILSLRTISYQDGVLIFDLINSAGKSLAITEEALPASYPYSALTADKIYATAYGQAYITSVSTRTTGALFTQDKTWVLINAPDPIGIDDMATLLDDLVPFNG